MSRKQIGNHGHGDDARDLSREVEEQIEVADAQKEEERIKREMDECWRIKEEEEALLKEATTKIEAESGDEAEEAEE